MSMKEFNQAKFVALRDAHNSWVEANKTALKVFNDTIDDIPKVAFARTVLNETEAKALKVYHETYDNIQFGAIQDSNKSKV